MNIDLRILYRILRAIALRLLNLSMPGFIGYAELSRQYYAANGVWIAATGGLRAAWFLSRTVALAAEIDLAVPLRRDAFVLSPYGSLHQPSAVSGRLSFGPELRF